jgi:hypothetical protein
MDNVRGPGENARGRRGTKGPYFLRPEREGAVSVYRRPAGNRIDPKLCGTMPSRAMAAALVSQLMRAESVVRDLFLEATDDGIEALEAVLLACRSSVLERGPIRESRERNGGGRPQSGRRRGRRRGGQREPRRPDRDAVPPPEMEQET